MLRLFNDTYEGTWLIQSPLSHILVLLNSFQKPFNRVILYFITVGMKV